MKPGDALIINGQTHLIVSSKHDGSVVIQHPNGTTDTYDELSLCKLITDHELRESIDRKVALQKLRDATDELKKETEKLRKAYGLKR